MEGILEALAKKEDNSEKIAKIALASPDALAEVIGAISSKNARAKFKAAKVLSIASEKAPEKLYSEWNFFVKLLTHKNKVLVWNAIRIIGNLTAADKEGKFEKIFNDFYGLMKSGSLITAANIVGISGRIANFKPKLADRIARELLRSAKVPLPTSECRNILMGHAMVAFGEFYGKLGPEIKKKVAEFGNGLLENSRPGTRQKAEEFLKIAT
ncbi:MAG: hypothetical protein PHH26_03610 [Candidatus Thermoplasmatota archaeon]|nr:hypothetical protein [Candidatus Thermoplasmatota archaeon]